MKREEILKELIKKNGAIKQLDMVTEECAELIQAINKAKRKGIVHNWGIESPAIESNLEKIIAYNNLCEEVADVKIMISQLEIMLSKENISHKEDKKIHRIKEKHLG